MRRSTKRMYRTYYGPDIRAIFERFVKPLLLALSTGINETALDHGVRRFFHADTRSVYFVRATRMFFIPSKIVAIKDSERRVERGAGLVLRTDSLEPDKIELEFNEHVFVLDQKSYAAVKPWLEIVA